MSRVRRAITKSSDSSKALGGIRRTEGAECISDIIISNEVVTSPDDGVAKTRRNDGDGRATADGVVSLRNDDVGTIKS